MLPVTFPLAFFKPIVPSFTSFLPCEDKSDFYRKKERISFFIQYHKNMQKFGKHSICKYMDFKA